MREHWHPSIKLVDIAEKTIEFTQKNIVKKQILPNMLTRGIHSMLYQDSPLVKIMLIVFILKFVLMIALCANDSKQKEVYHGLKEQFNLIQNVSNSSIN